jgi:serine/threonine protein kinase
MAQEIAEGLLFVHQQGLLHRDLHDRNILIDDGGHALIADFGLARPIDHHNTTGDTKGRAAFIPPERLRHDCGQLTVQGDVYSLGVILWELTVGREPFHGMTDLALGVAILEGKPDNRTPEWYRKLYTNCCAANPMERPNLGHVIQHLTQRGRYCACFHVHSDRY